MAFNPGLVLSSTSPASSEGSLRQGIRGSRLQDVLAEVLTKDKSFRRYAASIDRALGLFDSTLQEWADYISFLGRLLKALHAHPEGISIIPSKFTVAKRLAQCLHPSLPSGVHRKALEVYTFIFAFIQEDGLARDLSIYLPGIASTLTFASVSVRPLFLALIGDYVLKIPVRALRPALKALILSLLPGLDEETSDDFEKTLSTLHQCNRAFSSAGVGELFWQNLFLVSITSSSRRPGVLVYLNRHLPKLVQAEPVQPAPIDNDSAKGADVASITTPEPGLLLRCFATGLADQQPLVQRAFLDLLVTHMPLHASILLQEVGAGDLQLLVSAAVAVVLRRDMSLNRRLWSWFLGPELRKAPSSDETPSSTYQSSQIDYHTIAETSNISSYFQSYGVRPVIRSLNEMIVDGSRVPSEVSRPFRIALSLLDRWEIGIYVVNVIFLPLIRSLLAYQQNAMSTEDFGEAFRSANVFFDGVESNLVWSKMLSLVVVARKAKEDILQDLDLAKFIITNFNVREEEMLVLHMPLVSLAMLESLSQAEKSSSSFFPPAGERDVQSNALRLLGLMIDMTPDRAFALRDSSLSNSTTNTADDDNFTKIQDLVQNFLDHSQDSAKLPETPFAHTTISKYMLSLLTSMILAQIENDVDGYILVLQVQVLSLLIKKLPFLNGLDGPALICALKNRLTDRGISGEHLPFAIVSCAAGLVLSFAVDRQKHQIIRAQDFNTIVPVLVRRLWPYLSFSSPQHHIETVRLLERLHDLDWQEEFVSSTILSLLVEGEADSNRPYRPSKQALERFATLWTHSRYDCKIPIPSYAEMGPTQTSATDHKVDSAAAFSSMLSHSMVSVLSVLREPQTEVSAWCREWLQSIADLSSIFEAVITPIWKSLGLEDDNSIVSDNLDACSDLVEILYQLVAIQSKEQWLRFSHSPSSMSNSRSSSQANGSHVDYLQIRVARLCYRIVQRYEIQNIEATDWKIIRLQRATLNLLRRLFSDYKGETLLELQIDLLIVAQLSRSVVLQSPLLQTDLLDTLSLILNSKSTTRQLHRVTLEQFLDENAHQASVHTNKATPTSSTNQPARENMNLISTLEPPQKLLACLLRGITNPSSQDVIQKWIQVLCESMYLHPSSIFNNLMQIIECFCKHIDGCFSGMKAQYRRQSPVSRNFEYPLLHLLDGIDFVLARAQEQLLSDEEGLPTIISPESQQGFFGSMIPSTLLSEAKQGRKITNNNRLTVILCFQDAIETCFRLWSWHSLDAVHSPDTLISFQHASQKIRSRSRRILQHLLAAEPLECVEALVQIWLKARAENDTRKTGCLFDLVHTLEGSRPGTTMTTLFNAVSCRTQSSALAFNQKLTLCSKLQESDLVAFMCVYAQTLEDDVLAEVWKDCTNFLQHVLGNPMPHRQVLTGLINFIAILSVKLGNTNFGEEWKMRRELADLLARLLTAIFTIKPQRVARGKMVEVSTQAGLDISMAPDDIDQTLDRNFAAFSALLGESDRLVTVMVNVVSNVIAPLLHSRQFPQNFSPNALSLFLKISRIQSASKAWKRELMDSFNDGRFFSCATSIVKDNWLPLLRQLALAEKGLLPDILSRLGVPTAAGIMFGVGATAARLEADKKAQHNLRRVSCVLLAVEHDMFAAHLGLLQAKLEELLLASSISSPSSMTRAEIYMVIRALALNSSGGQMVSFWPMVITELRTAFSSMYYESEDASSSIYNSYSLLQAAKLLDVLLLINPEDFQPQEWIFITDTVDAIYRREGWEPSALIDDLAQSMVEHFSLPKAQGAPLSATSALPLPDEIGHNLGKPWLSGEQTRAIDGIDMMDRLLRPFFGQLSIHVYERTYKLSDPDLDACKDDLLADLFNVHTIVSAQEGERMQ